MHYKKFWSTSFHKIGTCRKYFSLICFHNVSKIELAHCTSHNVLPTFHCNINQKIVRFNFFSQGRIHVRISRISSRLNLGFLRSELWIPDFNGNWFNHFNRYKIVGLNSDYDISILCDCLNIYLRHILNYLIPMPLYTKPG